MAKLYALLVGINDYHPETSVNHLKGCVNDVNAMRDLLTQQYKNLDPDILPILNADATRENLLKSFESHLGKAGPDDIALFYYSGHGSYEKTSPEFETYDSKNQNETLVCYDSRLRGHFDLADKEIAVLLERLDPRAQKIVILDSCHSASVTRSDRNELSRKEPAREGSNGIYRRPIDSYMLPGDNYYLTQKAQGKIKIPATAHLLLSACSREEKALERIDEQSGERRGLFSTHMMEVLRLSDGKISYNDLYLQTRIAVIKERKQQTPRLDPLFGFNANLGFLSNTTINTRRYPAIWDKGLKLQLGQVHGLLPTETDDIAQISVLLFPVGQEGHPGIPASITKIAATESQLYAEGADENTTYEAEIVGLPKAMCMLVGVTGPVDKCEAILQLAEENPSPHLQFIEGEDGVEYSLEYTEKDDNILVWLIHVPSGLKVQGARNRDSLEACFNLIMPYIEQVEKWERYKAVEKRAARIDENKIDIKLELEQEDGQMHTLPRDQTEVSVDLDRASNGQDWETADFRLTINNRSREDLYVLVLGMSSSYGVSAYFNDWVDGKSGEVELMDNNFELHYKSDREVDVLKFFISSEEINPGDYTIEAVELGDIQEPRAIGNERAIGSKSASKKDDWFTKTFTITVSGNQRNIGKEASSINGMTFQENDKLNAKLSFGSIHTHTRSADPIYRLPGELDGSDFEIMNFAPPKSADKCVIELHDIQGQEQLKEQPLQIELDEKMEEGEMIIPVTFDGEFILPFGEVKETADHRPMISIDNLPAQVDDGRRSVGRALKFVLLKTVFKDKFDVFKLRWVDYSVKKRKRKTDGLKDKVANANKILLLIHGIIGDTKFMAEEAEFAVKDKGFDLVLTYDYENLDTDINVIAEKLDKDLKDVGLGSGHDKQLTIVAHSMGGLVSRYMIEDLRGDDGSVEKLMMFGTPNGGSRFGLAPGLVDDYVPEKYKELVKDKAKEWFKFATGLALNFLPGYVKTILEYVVKLAKLDEIDSPEVLNTLAMMSPEDDFIKGLVANTKASNTTYYIVAGDITNYQVSGGWFKRFVEKIEVGIGKVVYYNIPNDIAVGVEDIRKVNGVDKDTHTAVVPGHHLNYFENPPSVEKWKEWL
ncbi:MAG: caspase family protein [Saprospiraceae bacterium]|nr:caspase family protein [Saprospiraceae bacterium]